MYGDSKWEIGKKKCVERAKERRGDIENNMAIISNFIMVYKKIRPALLKRLLCNYSYNLPSVICK